jgi:hypothetical protein
MTDPAERQHNNWKKWYDKHCDEYNHMRSIQRDIKRGFIVNNSIHRQRPETTTKTPTLIEAKPRTKMSATEIRRRKVARELEKVEKRRQEWAAANTT